MDTTSKTPMLPRACRHRLWCISVGWIIVALLEAIAYTALALAIINHDNASSVVITAAITVIVTILVTRAGFLSGVQLSGDLYAALGHVLAHVKLSWFSDKHRAQIALLAGRGIPRLMRVPAHQLQTFLHAPLLPLFLLISIAWLSNLSTAILAALLLTASLTAQYFTQRTLARIDTGRHAVDQNEAQATMELINHMELLRTAAGSKRALERLDQAWFKQESTSKTTNLAAASATFISTLISVLPLGGVALWISYTTQESSTTILALLILTIRAGAPLGDLVFAALGLNDLRGIMHDYRQITNAPTLPEPNHKEAIQPKNYDLSLQQIEITHAHKTITTRISSGEKVQIAGPSGSGKSTLLSFLMRFDDPKKGRILLGEVPLPCLRYADLSANIAYAPQEAAVLTGTLADNIRLGDPNVSDETIERIARQVELGVVLDRSPQGIHQTVGQHGAKLSGGEQQRVALARALLKNAPILILDEATSALDEETESKIITTLRALPCTIIFTTHRSLDLWNPTHIIDLTEESHLRHIH